MACSWAGALPSTDDVLRVELRGTVTWASQNVSVREGETG